MNSQGSPWPGLGGFPLIVLSMINYKVAPKCHFFRNSQVGNPKIFEIKTFAIWKAHNFFCRLSIEVKLKKML